MRPTEVIRGWGQILKGRKPFLSIEITRECPLRCPGCYAYDEQHLGGGGLTLRGLSDYRGEELVKHFLKVVDDFRPLHLSIVGGDPLVRYRELEQILPALVARGIHIQLVTSAFRPVPAHWADVPRLNLVVSVDGLQPEHDLRRRPATYDRILKNIAGQHASIHCTATAQMLQRRGYIEDFVEFWTARPEAKRIWFSIFTPQIGDASPEIPDPEQRQFLIAELLRLRELYPKLDMLPEIIREFGRPPASPGECIFARTTATISADLKTRVAPCQFGGKPDCQQCGCIASMGLAALGHKTLVPGLSLGAIMHASAAIGDAVNRVRLRGGNPSALLKPSAQRHAKRENAENRPLSNEL
jgi:MoaA/NifB/PqqE/SkfB family radical SAM enzyme